MVDIELSALDDDKTREKFVQLVSASKVSFVTITQNFCIYQKPKFIIFYSIEENYVNLFANNAVMVVLPDSF